jgi:hypothetical protein
MTPYLKKPITNSVQIHFFCILIVRKINIHRTIYYVKYICSLKPYVVLYYTLRSTYFYITATKYTCIRRT